VRRSIGRTRLSPTLKCLRYCISKQQSERIQRRCLWRRIRTPGGGSSCASASFAWPQPVNGSEAAHQAGIGRCFNDVPDVDLK
jgi:hypothetical protein